MKDGPKRVLSQSMEHPWKASEAALTVAEDAASASTLLSSPKAPLRSMSHGNFRAISTSSSMSVGSPALAKRTISVVEEMETKQRENMNRKLKGLQLIAGSRSPQPKVEMPTIVDSRLAKTSALTRSTLRRDSVANYQAVTPAALSLKGGGTTPATPRFSLNGPELFPLRASHSLTSLNRVYDRGLSVFVSDDYDSYSTTGKGITDNQTDNGNVLPGRTSLSSSVHVEYLSDVHLTPEIKPTDGKVVENAVDNIFKAISLTGGDAQYTSDYKQRSKQLTSGISPAASGPPLNLKTFPKPQIPKKPADFKAFTSKEDKAKILNGGNAELNDYNQILLDSNHSSVGVAKDTSLSADQQLLEPQEKTGYLARNYNTADLYRRSQLFQEDDVNRQDTRLAPQPPKASFNARLHSDLVIPYASDPEVPDFISRATSSRLGVVSGPRMGLPSTNTTPCFISHQKMDSLLSDSNTVDSGLGRSEAAGSPGSHYQDSADELDSKGYTGWTATTTEFSNEGRDDKPPPKRLTKKEFVSTAVIRLSPPVTETPRANYIEIKPTVKDHKIVSTRQSYHQETPLPASSSHRGTSPQETSDHVHATQRMTSVPSKYSHSSSSSSSYLSSTTPNQPTSGFITSDSKVPAAVEAETSRPIRVSGKKSHRDEGISVPSFDVQSNQKNHLEHKKKTTTSVYETNSSESSYTSGSRYARSHRESDATEVKRRAEDQSLQRDLHESETRVRDDEPQQRSRIRNKLFEDFADGRKETRTEVSQSSASNRKNQEQFFNDALRTRTRNDARETPEVRNESKLFHEPRRTETRTETRRETGQTHEVKNESYVSRDPQFVERTQFRQTTHTNSSGFEPRHQSTGTKKDEETAVMQGNDDDDDGMMGMEVQLIKGFTGLGFCIEGGIDSPVGDKPITVKRLFKGESAAKGKLQPGDIIVAINGKPLSNKSHYQAWNQLKSLPEGPINLAIRRLRPLPAGTLV